MPTVWSAGLATSPSVSGREIRAGDGLHTRTMWRCPCLLLLVLVVSGHDRRENAQPLKTEAEVEVLPSGGLLEDARRVMRRDRSHMAMGQPSGAEEQEMPSPDACDSGGESTAAGPLTFNMGPPTEVPFTLSLRVKFTGDDPPKMKPNPACVLCWSIDPDTKPSDSKAQFFRGYDGQPPRIALVRLGNVLSYEEFSADGGLGTSNSFTSVTKLNDDSEHEVVLVRGTQRITLWIDGRPDSFVAFGSDGFKTAGLPKGSPGKLYGNAATTNNYLRRKASQLKFYNHKDPFDGKWALTGEVANVRFYNQELSGNQFPDSKLKCEETTTAAPYECHSTCKSCNGASEEDCTSCEGLRFLHQKKCVEACPDGRYGDPDAQSCEKCHKSCATCSGAKATSCETCATDSFLYQGKCISACPANHFADEQGLCKPLAGAVIALKTTGNGETYLVTSHRVDCVKMVPLEEQERRVPQSIQDTGKMWMVSASKEGLATLRNVRTGMALQMPSQKASASGCSSSLSTCAVARPPKPVHGEKALWTDSQWGSHQCSGKNAFSITALGNSQMSLLLGNRFLQFSPGHLELSKELPSSTEGSAASNQRFEPLVVLPALKATVKTSGRCSELIFQALQCSSAAGGLGMDGFADFTEQGTDTKRPPGCYYYTHELFAPASTKEYLQLPVKVTRVALNLLKAGAQADYSHFADCSVKSPCICRKA